MNPTKNRGVNSGALKG